MIIKKKRKENMNKKETMKNNNICYILLELYIIVYTVRISISSDAGVYEGTQRNKCYFSIFNFKESHLCFYVFFTSQVKGNGRINTS